MTKIRLKIAILLINSILKFELKIFQSLNEYIDTLVAEEQQYEEEENDLVTLWIIDDLEWKPQLDLLFRYGAWLTSTRKFWNFDDNIIEGIPKNFVEKLLLHMEYSRYYLCYFNPK